MTTFRNLLENYNFRERIEQIVCMESCEFFYLNGEKIDISFHNTKPPNPIPLNFIREHIKDSIPEDFIFLSNKGEIINKEDEDKTFTSEELATTAFYIYSDTLYSKRNYAPKKIILDFKKLEEKEEFIIYEYPNKDIKEDEQFYSIVLFGNNKENIKFINGFVNYLYDIKKEDKFRLKFTKEENNDSKKETEFSKVYNIKHEKGNFKFYCFNFSVELDFNFKEISELEKIINNGDKDIHVDFIVYNKIDYTYDKRLRNAIFNDDTNTLGRRLSKTDLKGQNASSFFAGPNLLFSDIMFELRRCIVGLYGNDTPDNAYDKSRIDIKEKYGNALLYYCFCDYNSIYKTKNDKFEICEFNRIMDGFSRFYTGLLNAPKNNQFQVLRDYFISINLLFRQMRTKYNEYQEKKLEYCSIQERKQNHEAITLQLESTMKELDFLSNKNKQLKDYIELYQETIIKNYDKQLIPYLKEDGKIINYEDKKTMVCDICLYNCHINCKDKFKNFCKAFDFKFDCKVCPNKCPAYKHSVFQFEYPQYLHKKMDELFPNSLKSPRDKVNFALSHLEKEKKEINDKLIQLKKDLIDIKKDNISENDMYIMNKELNEEIENFMKLYLFRLKIKESFEDEVFKVFIFSFFKIDYVYDYIVQ